MKHTYEELAGMIDHSLLHPALTDAQIEEGCRLAARYRVASVCVKPAAVPLAAAALAGTGVRVGAVAGFPHGSGTTRVKRFEIEAACEDGAQEVDATVNVGKVLGGQWDYVEKELRALCEAAHAAGAIIKIIFETDFLPDDETKIRLCRASADAGADFVKTSTGFGFVRGPDGRYGYRGATERDIRLMRAHCPSRVGVKAAGGVRDLDALIRMREAGASRCGATATAAILDEYRRRAAAEAGSTG